MSISYTPENMPYKKLTPFKRYVLQNFPWINEDFDALTNYELMGKIIEYLNNVIDSQNELNEKFEEIYNYFENLDVQDEINNKLDEMAESGELSEIIAQYLQLAGLLCYNTLNDMKNAENLVDGSNVRCLGTNNYNDGKGAYYKIRTLLNTDIIDNYNIIPLNNYPTLIAERLKQDEIITNILDYNSKIYSFKNRRVICIGDSYLTGSTAGQMYATQGWAERFINLANLQNSYYYGDGGSGFTVTGHKGFNFETLITSNLNNIANKNTITDIIVCGGYNDKSADETILLNAINSFVNVCKNNFPNAKIYIGCIAGNSAINENGKLIRNQLLNVSLNTFKKCNSFGALYLNNTEIILKDYSLISSDTFHPTPEGYQVLAEGILQSWNNGNVIKCDNAQTNILENNNADLTNVSSYSQIINNNTLLGITGILVFRNEQTLQLNTPLKLGHINSKHIRKSYNSALYFDHHIKIGNAVLSTDSMLYIDDNNDLYVVFYSLPSGISNGRFFNFARFNVIIPTVLC